MIFVSVTRLRLRKLRFLPGFAFFSLRSVVQAKRTSGCVHARAIRETGSVFWTITLWKEEAAMRFFRNSGAHSAAMPKLAEWCDEATYVHWLQEAETPPTLLEAHARLVSEGKISKVRFPSAAHATRAFPAPQQ
jgi:Domain of unknown function (DUF3291)